MRQRFRNPIEDAVFARQVEYVLVLVPALFLVGFFFSLFTVNCRLFSRGYNLRA